MPSPFPIEPAEAIRRLGLSEPSARRGLSDGDWALWDDGAFTSSTPATLAAAGPAIFGALPGHRLLMGNTAAAQALELLLSTQRALAITGTRRSTSEASEWFTRLATAWKPIDARMPWLVHGGAIGTDQALAAAWRSVGGGEVIVLGGGIAHARDCHPLRPLISANAGSRAAVLSLCPPAQPTDAASLVRRNRLIALLGSCLLVGQVMGGRGGAWHTVRGAVEFHRPLFRLPDAAALMGAPNFLPVEMLDGQERLRLAGARELPSNAVDAAMLLNHACLTHPPFLQAALALREALPEPEQPDLFAGL
jgi:hypothetical protein